MINQVIDFIVIYGFINFLKLWNIYFIITNGYKCLLCGRPTIIQT